MKLDFDFSDVSTIEFGVGRDEEGGQTFCRIPVDKTVQAALDDMAQLTWKVMCKDADPPARYEPSEKHGPIEHLYLPLTDSMAGWMHTLHGANNLTSDSTSLARPDGVFCYFARLKDSKNRRLTAVRRATQFKGVLRSRLVRIFNDALRVVEDRVFKLDHDFDVLIDSKNVHILRPSGFEFVGQLQSAIMAAVPANVVAIAADLSFVDFSGIESYASQHPRAARYLASIRGQKLKNMDKERLRKLCKSTNVTVTLVKGKVCVQGPNVMGFLEVLDRRRYEVDILSNEKETFRAASRSKLG